MTSEDDLKGAADKFASRASSSAQDASDSAKASESYAAEQAQGLAGQAGEAASNLYGKAKDHVQGLSERLPNSASDAYQAGQRAYAQGSDRVSRQVVKQPIEALLLAGALGYLVGWATSRS